jgi:hypothetical protein
MSLLRSAPLYIYVATQSENKTDIKVWFAAIASSRLPPDLTGLPDDTTVPRSLIRTLDRPFVMVAQVAPRLFMIRSLEEVLSICDNCILGLNGYQEALFGKLLIYITTPSGSGKFTPP